MNSSGLLLGVCNFKMHISTTFKENGVKACGPTVAGLDTDVPSVAGLMNEVLEILMLSE